MSQRLGLLAAEPGLDRRWEHHPSHFWLIFTVAGINVALGLIASEAAARRDDNRTFLVSMALLVSAGFLGLHALATPGILLDGLTAGFSVAARIGLLLASVFAAVSALGPARGSCASWPAITAASGWSCGWSWPPGRSPPWPGSRCSTGPCHPTPCRHPSAS